MAGTKKKTRNRLKGTKKQTQNRSKGTKKQTQNRPSRKFLQDHEGYKSFFLGKTKFCVGDTISVANPDTVKWQQDTQDGKAGADDQPTWAARIISIFAMDRVHVYAWVQWFYSPSDLPEKARADGSFGKQELILSNHTDLIPAQSAIDILQVEDLHDGADNVPGDGMLHWKRFWDFDAQEFSSDATFISL
ncbi:hypothetical protein QBC35DRAFT_466743 [Podospora australis]|uniref:BAH domain-containing protein n=1 Tax=Podospora australis TaxID=1536484 RepID=A0AAN6WM28_9PEZI|nr:hypothetical protein QBC35DRAFT_466743 [Podospora australis]